MKTKKILAGALAAAVVATSLPGMGVPVFAAGSFLTPNSNCYTTDNPFAFPMGAGEVKTLEAELATTLYNDTSNNENNRWPMKIQTENGVTAVYDMAKNGDYATYAYTAEAGLYLVTAHYACGGNNTMVVSDAVTKSDKVNTVFVQVASTSVNNIPQWRTTQFLLRINKTGAGTLKIASTSGNQAEDAPRLDKLEITKMQMPKYEGENRFSFPTELNAATPATLEAEYGIITNVITTEDENGNYPAQEKMDNDRGKDPWTGNRYFLTSVNTGDSVAYAYHAEKPGIYEFTARYRSGSNDNHYTWSSTDSKIVAGSVQAGHTDSSATQTKTFKVAVAEAGDGILTFAAPNPSSSGKKNMAMTDKFDITLVVDKSALVSAIENVKDLNLADYEDAGKEAFTTALTTAKTVNTNYTDALTQEKVNDAVDALNTAKNALTLKATTTDIRIKTQPVKKVYNLNEAVNTTGLVVEAVKDNNTTEELASDAYTVALDSTAIGTKKLTVTLKANTTLTATTDVEVVDGARLDAKVTEAEAKTADKHYTSATKEAFDAKLSAAKTVQDDIKVANGDNNVTASGTAVTAARVADAITALDTAMNDLEEVYKVTVPAGAELTVVDKVENEPGSDDTNKWVYVPVATKVMVKAPETNASGEKFAAWTWDKQKLSESNEYAFYVVGDMNLQMTYDASTVDEAEVVLVGSTKYTEKEKKRSFIAKRSVSKKCEKVLEYGVVVTDQTGWDRYYKVGAANPKLFKKGNTRTKYSRKYSERDGLLAYNGTFVANLKVADKNEKWYGRPYVIYQDAKGVTKTVYADKVIKY